MYSSVVAPECRLSRNIRENFAMFMKDVHEALQTLRTVEHDENKKKEVKLFIDLIRTIYVSYIF